MASLPKAPLRQLQTQLLARLQTLPALSMHQPQAWDLTGPVHFLAQGYRLLFLDGGLVEHLTPYLDYSFETVKLINPRQPAVKLSFYDKHKYWLLKDGQLPLPQRQAEIERYLQLLLKQRQRLEQQALSPHTPAALIARQQQLTALQEQIRRWRQIHEQPQAYELVMSTYYSEYRYWYISWKYALDPTSFANATSHLLSPRRARNGSILETKLNVVFVDVAAIGQTHDYQHKQIGGYLEQFTYRSQGLKGQLFARPLAPDATAEPEASGDKATS